MELHFAMNVTENFIKYMVKALIINLNSTNLFIIMVKRYAELIGINNY